MTEETKAADGASDDGLAAIQRDAARFRFLLSITPDWIVMQKNEPTEHYAVRIGWRTTKTYKTLTEFIDAAMSANMELRGRAP